MTGTITTIQRMSVHDGPGLRSVVFMKGCNMRCRWCHNPETWSRTPQLQYVAEKCIGCLTCAAVCPSGAVGSADGPVFERSVCTSCGTCADACPARALTMVGREVSVGGLWEEVAKDLPYFLNSGGGITVSGGEPLLQADFVKQFLTLCRENGLNTAIQTNASLDWRLIEDLIPVTDLWMCDLKVLDSGKHKAWTGIGNDDIIRNITALASEGHELVVRTPVIPGVNDTVEEIDGICRILAPYAGIVKYVLLGFHTLGFGKFVNLGMHNSIEDMEPLPRKRLEELKSIPLKYDL